MTKSPNKPKIVKRFIEHYLVNFENRQDAPELLLDLVANGIIDPERLRNYMIVADYHAKLAKYNGHVKTSIMDLSESYNLSERQIQNIVYKWSGKYRVRSNIENPQALLAELSQ